MTPAINTPATADSILAKLSPLLRDQRDVHEYLAGVTDAPRAARLHCVASERTDELGPA
ncbi:hypothetical protein [Pararobbsia alpina]|uniref:Uncharacterized protein n=1 Tax=Pararobbsia alpina TaxID=621374 RepID=A0A6S7B3Q9_9BURK|nr:hypothetical protein [Pararobbsia alpina]CAB3784512.1 hypothetical protein LMG28138_01824 [Pararobbsia alpina]